MTWWTAGIFFALTVVFFAGKGSFLIAGYNTASKKEKERYDEKKLCRLMGCCMGVITISLVVSALLGERAPDEMHYIFCIIVILDVLITVILSNTICLRKGVPAIEEKSPEEKQRERKWMRISWGIILVVFSLAGIMLTTGNIRVNLNEENMEIKGSYWPDMKISWEKIQRVVYKEHVKAGSRTGGLGSFRLQEGRFQNGEFGDYARYTYVKCETYVVMETTGGILVVNQETEEKTEKLYEEILAKMEEKSFRQ